MESTPPVTAEGAPEPAQPEPVAADEAVKDVNMQAAAAPPADVQNTAGESSDLKQPEAAAEVPQAQGGEAAVEAEPAARESMQQETETPAVNSVSLANADVADDEEEIELEDDIEDMAAEEEQGLSVSASGLPADLAAIADLVAADVPSKPVGGDTEMCLKPVIAALPSGQSAGAKKIGDDDKEEEEESSSSESESSSSESEPEAPPPRRSKAKDSDDDEDGGPAVPLKTKNEIVPPPPPAVEISRVEGRLEKLGSVLSNVEDSVVVQAQPGPPPLDEGTILAFEDRTPLGVICEIFGPVYEPLYVVRLSKGEEARAALAQVGTAIFFSPEMMTLVDQQACMIKGSDASNMFDEEPAAEEQEYSDDEEEAEAKRRAKNKKRPQGKGREGGGAPEDLQGGAEEALRREGGGGVLNATTASLSSAEAVRHRPA